MSRRVIVGTALVSVSLGACGGGGGGSGVTRAQYITRADQICRATAAEAAPLLRQLVQRAGSLSPASVHRLAPLGMRIHTLAVAYLDRISALPQPSKDAGEINRFLRPSRQAVDTIGQAAGAAKAGNMLQALGLLREAQGAANAANAAAGAYGLSDCATVLSLG